MFLVALDSTAAQLLDWRQLLRAKLRSSFCRRSGEAGTGSSSAVACNLTPVMLEPVFECLSDVALGFQHTDNQ